MRIFSGIQPTGEKHLGNLIGGFRQYAATQEQGERTSASSTCTRSRPTTTRSIYTTAHSTSTRC